jgi:hypothetical protein
MNNEEYLKSVIKESVVEALNELFGGRKEPQKGPTQDDVDKYTRMCCKLIYDASVKIWPKYKDGKMPNSMLKLYARVQGGYDKHSKYPMVIKLLPSQEDSKYFADGDAKKYQKDVVAEINKNKPGNFGDVTAHGINGIMFMINP